MSGSNLTEARREAFAKSHVALVQHSVLKDRLIKCSDQIVRAPLKHSVSINNYVENFASETNVHGLKEIYKSKTPCARSVWVLVCLICTASALYGICNVIQFYQNDDRIATKITVLATETMVYPTLLLCPIRWINLTVMEELNISQQLLYYRLVPLDTDHIMHERHLDHKSSRPPESVETEFERLKATQNLTDSASFYRLIAIRPHSFVHCSCCNKSAVETLVTLKGICFKIPLCESDSVNKKSPTITYVVNRTQLYPLPTIAEGAYVSFYDPDAEIERRPRPRIFLAPGRPVEAKLRLSIVSRVTRKKQPCHQPDKGLYTPHAICDFRCQDEHMYKICCRCSLLTLFSSNETFTQCRRIGYTTPSSRPFCNAEQYQIQLDRLQRCRKNCTVPCTEQIYDILTFMVVSTLNSTEYYGVSDPNVDILQLTMSYQAFAKTLLEDIKTTLTFDTLISSIGGQTGLWCGASIISIFQVISYCCCPCLHYIERQGKKSFSKSFRFKRAAALRKTKAKPETSKTYPETEPDSIITPNSS